MTAIGLRVYRVNVYQDHVLQPFGKRKDQFDLKAAVNGFTAVYSTAQAQAGQFRSFFFQPQTPVGNISEGLVRYGNSGFSSELVDGSTQTLKYLRQNSDVEVIPLYYCFWIPDDQHTAFAVFQSFGGRSCIAPIQNELVAYVYDNFAGARVVFQKVMPDDLLRASKRPIQKITLHKRKNHRDIADKFVEDGADQIDLTLSFEPSNRGNLGLLDRLVKRFREERDTLNYNGIDFDGLSADVRVGRTVQRIGIIGITSNAGVIDVTDDVSLVDGHPTLQSIAKVTAEVLADFISDFA